MQTTPSTPSWADSLGAIVAKSPGLAIALVLLLSAGTIAFVYLLLRDRLSKGARDIAEASKLMAESLRYNTESLATAPQIVLAFSSLVESTIKRELIELDGKISSTVAREFQSRATQLEESSTEARSVLQEMKAMRSDILAINRAAVEQQVVLEQELSKIRDVIPDYSVWKNVADPELLVRRLHRAETWDQGKDIVAQLQNLCNSSADAPELIPAQYLEIAGDWCRRHNQFPLALWFYEHAVARDPERISAQVELLALRAEYIYPRREESLRELRQLVVERPRSLNDVRRLLNVLIELERWSDIDEICSALLSNTTYGTHPSDRAIFLRNRAVARRHLAFGHLTDAVWADIRAALSLHPDEENALKVYANWLVEAKQYEEAIKIGRQLVGLDRADVTYYTLLSRAHALNGQIQEARRMLDMAEDVTISPSSQLQIAQQREEVDVIEARIDPHFWDAPASQPTVSIGQALLGASDVPLESIPHEHAGASSPPA
ncbi:MAG TPA: hypothetical protein VF929_08340 [Gemmatimonadaceae bacterium]